MHDSEHNLLTRPPEHIAVMLKLTPSSDLRAVDNHVVAELLSEGSLRAVGPILNGLHKSQS